MEDPHQSVADAKISYVYWWIKHIDTPSRKKRYFLYNPLNQSVARIAALETAENITRGPLFFTLWLRFNNGEKKVDLPWANLGFFKKIVSEMVKTCVFF